MTAALYAPESYVRAVPDVRRYVANGCGPSGWKGYLVPETIYLLPVREACDIHDWMYAEGETIADKDSADRTFLNNLLRLINAAGGPRWLVWLRTRRALKYYKAVCLFGGPAFWKEKNPPETRHETSTAWIESPWPEMMG
jgi:hypothetical protein